MGEHELGVDRALQEAPGYDKIGNATAIRWATLFPFLESRLPAFTATRVPEV